MRREELDKLSWNIPLSVLREKYPELHSRSKQVFIDRLREENIEELKSLALYYSMKRKKSVFFIRVKKDLLAKIKDFEGKRIKLDDIDNIFEINEVLRKGDHEYVVEINAHSQIYREENLENPVTLKGFSVEYRKPFLINLICHLDTSIVEISTRSHTKVLTTIRLFSHIFGCAVEDFEIIILKAEEKTLKDNIHFKEVVLNGLNLAGSKQIIIKGPDVKRTLDVFKDKGFDLESEAKDTKFIKSEMDKEPISFDRSGKISFSKIVDVYQRFKKVLTGK